MSPLQHSPGFTSIRVGITIHTVTAPFSQPYLLFSPYLHLVFLGVVLNAASPKTHHDLDALSVSLFSPFILANPELLMTSSSPVLLASVFFFPSETTFHFPAGCPPIRLPEKFLDFFLFQRKFPCSPLFFFG